MCGIVGLFLKDPALEPHLGALVATMLEAMTGRGPDSAGFALFADRPDEAARIIVRGDTAGIPEDLARALAVHVTVERCDTHARIRVPRGRAEAARDWLRTHRPRLTVTGVGERMEVYKEIGLPAAVATRFGLAAMSGTHAIGHTRMATESAITAAGAHPFSTGSDQCLVHNGSLSNHASLRRRLRLEGFVFETDNDSEVAAAYLSWRIHEGATLAQALEACLGALDGFYTFVVGTADGFAVIRDPIACKPAVMAETAAYVAFASEYRALSDLPGIDEAHLFEPEPARVYAWQRR